MLEIREKADIATWLIQILFVCCSFLSGGRQGVYLFRSTTEKDHSKSGQYDSQIQFKREILDVIQLVFELVFRIFDGGSILIFHLSPACDPWSDTVPAPVHGNHLFEHLTKLRLFWAWTHKTHLAA